MRRSSRPQGTSGTPSSDGVAYFLTENDPFLYIWVVRRPKIRRGRRSGTSSKPAWRRVWARASLFSLPHAAKWVGAATSLSDKRPVNLQRFSKRVLVSVVPPGCGPSRRPVHERGVISTRLSSQTPWRSVWAFLNVMCMHVTKKCFGAVLRIHGKRPVASSFVGGCILVRGIHPRTRGSGPCFPHKYFLKTI